MDHPYGSHLYKNVCTPVEVGLICDGIVFIMQICVKCCLWELKILLYLFISVSISFFPNMYFSTHYIVCVSLYHTEILGLFSKN